MEEEVWVSNSELNISPDYTGKLPKVSFYPNNNEFFGQIISGKQIYDLTVKTTNTIINSELTAIPTIEAVSSFVETSIQTNIDILSSNIYNNLNTISSDLNIISSNLTEVNDRIISDMINIDLPSGLPTVEAITGYLHGKYESLDELIESTPGIIARLRLLETSIDGADLPLTFITDSPSSAVQLNIVSGNPTVDRITISYGSK